MVAAAVPAHRNAARQTIGANIKDLVFIEPLPGSTKAEGVSFLLLIHPSSSSPPAKSGSVAGRGVTTTGGVIVSPHAKNASSMPFLSCGMVNTREDVTEGGSQLTPPTQILRAPKTSKILDDPAV
jgi:hypothetical protein